MSLTKKFLIAFISFLVPFSAVSAAQAAGESVSADNTLTPRSGSFFKQKAVPSNLKLDVVVTPGPGEALVEPLKNVKVTFPAGMTFNPNNKVCPDSALNSQSSLGNPATVVNSCADSVVGTGTATILLSRQVAVPLTDPILVAFNAGKTANGQPKLKIYGFSKGTGVGILMTGTLSGRVLDIAVPVLSFDSAVLNFSLEFPGGELKRPDIGVDTRGLDPSYVQTRCGAAGSQVTDSVFELGTRDPATGTPTGPTSTLNAPQVVKPWPSCANGKPRFANLNVKGPKGVKRGRVGTFRVTVRNNGTANARNVVVTTNRGGRARLGQIAPGKAKTARVKVRIKGRKGQRLRVRFLAKSGNVKKAAVRQVRVR